MATGQKPKPRSVSGKGVGKATLARNISTTDKNWLLENCGYEGSQAHKTHLGSFSLHPPADPHPDKNICNTAPNPVTCPSDAQDLLEKGIQAGLVSQETKYEDFPALIWSVRDDGQVFEARYGGSRKGMYHGYPLLESDGNYDMISACMGRL